MKKPNDEELNKCAENMKKNHDIILKFIEPHVGKDYFYLNKMVESLIINSAFDLNPKKWWIDGGNSVKCDALGCDWKHENLDLNYLQFWLNVPCPKCGSNVLTEKDIKNILILNWLLGSKVIRFLNWIGKKFGCKIKRYKVKMNGTGTMELEDITYDRNKTCA